VNRPSDQKRPHILITNDDGIQSTGLWTLADALRDLGNLTIAAPREQSSGSGRSLSPNADGRIEKKTLSVNGRQRTGYAVGGSPSQTVAHAILELMQSPPDLVISGINYGENLGSSITISGTIGAAIEAAVFGVPALAVSLQMSVSDLIHQTPDIDFTAAAAITARFAQQVLCHSLPTGVDILKIDIPEKATLDTAWRMTHLGNHPYYKPIPDRQGPLEEPYVMGWENMLDPSGLDSSSDIYTVMVDRVISVTPLTIDMTARIDLSEFEKHLRS
jgi:5'-nucleotidase